LTPGSVLVNGLDEQHRIGVTLDNVVLDGLKAEDIRASHAEVRVGPHAGNLLLSGTDVALQNTGAVPAVPLDCQGRFPPLSRASAAPAAAVTIPPDDPTLYVAASGTGDYYSIQRAIDVAPAGGAVISIAPGIYRETLTITKPNIRLRGPYQDAARTVIVFDKSAETAGGTLKSATVNVLADNFGAENLTIANDYNATHPQLPQGSQALALLVTGDRAVFHNVRVLGNQDTLYAGSRDCNPQGGQTCVPSRQYFSECTIAGNVDFIFGDGKAFFDRCEIRSTNHSIGFITAQGKRYPEQDSGFVFDHCRLTSEPGVTNVWLGRPWRPYATVVFLDTEMGGHLEEAGWREWHPGETNSISTAFYAEYKSSGPGAGAGKRDPHTRRLDEGEAARFRTGQFLAGSDHWNPAGRVFP
jgi:pectin methylesterase-like acyl-CoA thioesterase